MNIPEHQTHQIWNGMVAPCQGNAARLIKTQIGGLPITWVIPSGACNHSG
jgi:hypothetical protein